MQETDFRETLHPRYFTSDNKYVYAFSNIGHDKTAVIKYDIKNDKELEVIYTHPEVDVEYMHYSNLRKELNGVSFVTWKREYKFFNKERAAILNYLQQQLKGKEIIAASRDSSETKFILRTFSDKSLGAYYYFNVASNELKKLSDVGSWLDENKMSDMKPIRYKARDGFTLFGYLTIPKNVKHENLPTIVIPHGGPWLRDSWGFDAEAQFLANRGYLVLQVNFRGSTGYGRHYWEAGFKEWGRKMQDDVTDGVDWLILQGLADPDRIAIMGYSFGGYSALTGVVSTPDKYRCAISYAGIMDVPTFLNSIPPVWEPFREMLYNMVGDPVKDKELLEEISPLRNTDKINVPVFIAQGANDAKAPKEITDEFVKLLSESGVEVEYMVKENEGHGFRNEENRLEYFKAIEAFLKRHMTSSSESIGTKK